MDLEFLCFNFINEFFYLGRGRSSIAKNEHHLHPCVGVIDNSFECWHNRQHGSPKNHRNQERQP